MWLFNAPPLEQLRVRYGFEPSAQWLEHLQHSSIRFNNGGSGAFVSPDALIITNHHIGIDCLSEISTERKNLVANGFLAKTRADELPCRSLELNVLASIEDVTARVNAAGNSESDRRAAIAAIEEESFTETKLRSDVVTLYQGGAYHLYRYHAYTDVRLVFAPEEDAAFFGGDPDNFEYPRYNFDVCFFRAYENGRPAPISHWLRWSAAGAKEGDLVLSSGNPGFTDRGRTAAHLAFLRDIVDPFILERIRRRELTLRKFAQRSTENERRAANELLNLENARKSYEGELAALQDPATIEEKRAAEASLRQSEPEPWQTIERALAADRALHVERRMFESAWGFDSALFSQARQIVRHAAESAKPNGERLREFTDARLIGVQSELLAETSTWQDLDARMLADSLALLLEKFPDDPLVRQVMAGKGPKARATELVRGTKLGDVEVRRALLEGGAEAVDASDDPMILLAKLVDERARNARRRWESEVEEPLRQAYAKIASARFRTAKSDLYPDATFSPRLGFGTVRGYVDEEGVTQPWSTTIAGLYDRAAARANAEPYDLPERWLARKGRVALATPFNFVAAIDTVGGSSGSPLVDRSGSMVGLVFDGNLPTLGFSFAYQERDGRTIAVHTRGIVEILRAVYGATGLVRELGASTNA